VRSRSAELRIVPGGRAPRGRTVAVTGGKGGVGKSTLALNLGLVLADRAQRTVLVDTDLGAAGLSVLLGASTDRGLRAVLGGAALDDELVASHGAWLLPGALGGGDLRAAGDANLRRTLAVISTLANRFDTVIVDVAAGVGDEQAALAAAADDVVVVVTPDPPSLAAAFACLQRLDARGVTRAFVLPNQSSSSEQADDIASRLSTLVHRLLDIELIVLPAIPADPDVRESMLAALPVVVRRPDSAASRGVLRVRHALDSTFAHTQSSTGASS
jgi:flagellar biosynthesis protein FlhG